MKTLDFNLLIALDALLAIGSVSIAAQRMHLSTPTMSHTLARIRAALGDPIHVRTWRRLVSTPRALELLEPLHKLVEQARCLMQPADGRGLALQREFVVRAPEGTAIVHGALPLAALRQTLPLAPLRFVPECDIDGIALLEGRIDLDIGAVHDRGPEIRTSPLFEQQFVAALREGHRLLAGRVALKRFCAETHVAIGQRGRAREAFDRLLAEAGAARRIALTVPIAYSALMAAARSKMVACAPEPLARGVTAGLGLVIVKLPVAVPAEQVVQAWHPRFDADPAHQCLRHRGAALSARGPYQPFLASEGLGGSQRHHALLKLAHQSRAAAA
jgi:DNA-binding transcriptional LysR family regulator